MKRIQTLALAGVAAVVLAGAAGSFVPAYAQMSEKTVTVGGAPMYPSKNIVQNAVNSKDHTTLVAAVKAAGLAATLSSPGPFTVCADQRRFQEITGRHGRYSTKAGKQEDADERANLSRSRCSNSTAKDLMSKVKDGNGKATLKTVEGEDLTVTQDGSSLTITDAKGDKAMVTIANVMQSNGVIHVIDTVLLPG